MELLIGLVMRVALLVAAWKVYRWSKGLSKSSGLRWRRRVGLIFFLAPFVLWFGEVLLPEDTEALLAPLRALGWINEQLKAAVQALIGVLAANTDGLVLFALKPLCYALVFTTAGVLVGWPLDALTGSKKDAEDAELQVEQGALGQAREG